VTWLLVVFTAFAAACVKSAHVPEAIAVPLVMVNCDTEARQLDETAAVYPAPQSGLAPIAKLEKGRFVYRCVQRGDWLGVMFPKTGEKVDCAERPPERPCSPGWIRRNTKMAING
jgi:hypothetical protein